MKKPSCGHMDRHRQNDWGSVRYDPRFDEYWLPAGGARQQLFFCPWCGERLPESQGDRWFAELEARGIDPLVDRVPKEFNTGAWRGAGEGTEERSGNGVVERDIVADHTRPVAHEFVAAWADFHPGAPPLAHLLRLAEGEQWVRCHSLGGGQRYANSEVEASTVLERANRLASRVLGEGSDCWLIVSDPWYEQDGKYEQHWTVDQFGLGFALEYASPDEGCSYQVFAGRVAWSAGAFDDLIWFVAEDRLRPSVMWMQAHTGAVFAPYDGGTDLFAASGVEAGRLKSEFAEWLSDRADGL